MVSRRSLIIQSGGVVALSMWPLLSVAQGTGAPGTSGGDGAETRERLVRQLMQFIRNAYLGEGQDAPKATLGMYAVRVDYFDRGEISRERVLAEKQAYYQRWPKRSFAMVDGSLKPQASGDDEIEIFFRFSFEVANAGDTRKGIANATLRIALEGERFVIRGEKSSVEKRL
jgi:hypothetical protein